MVMNPPAIAGDRRVVCSIPGLGRSPGEGNGDSLKYSCLNNPMDRHVPEQGDEKVKCVTSEVEIVLITVSVIWF